MAKTPEDQTMIRMNKSTVKQLKQIQLDLDMPNIREVVQMLVDEYNKKK